MKLRSKTLLMIGTTLAILIFISYEFSQTALVNSFTQLEEQNALNNIQQVQSGISSDTSRLDGITKGWAVWDYSYKFVKYNNTEYIETNLEDDSLSSLKINIIVFGDNSGGMNYQTYQTI